MDDVVQTHESIPERPGNTLNKSTETSIPSSLSETLPLNMMFSERWFVYLTLWKDTDPGIAEVEDVKKRLAALKSH